MYIRNPVPRGPHTAYIFQDKIEQRFKIGMSANLEERRKKICYELYGRRSQNKITKYCSWTCQSFFAALFVEQATISILNRYGFEPVRSSDWFVIDKHTLSELVEIVADLARAIKLWEFENYNMRYNFLDFYYQAHPYGRYLKANKLGESELRRAIIDNASNEFLDDFLKEIKRERNLRLRQR